MSFSTTAVKRWSCQDKELPPVGVVKNIHVYDFDNTRKCCVAAPFVYTQVLLFNTVVRVIELWARLPPATTSIRAGGLLVGVQLHRVIQPPPPQSAIAFLSCSLQYVLFG